MTSHGLLQNKYINISAKLAQVVVDKGWIPSGAQKHYLTHEGKAVYNMGLVTLFSVLDVSHAEELIDLATKFVKTEEDRVEAINGMLLGAYYFWNLYSDMSKASKALKKVRETEFFKFHPRRE